MDIEKNTVEYLAKLARIRMTDEEINRMRGELATIISYVSQLNTVGTEVLNESRHILPLENIWREDATAPSLPRNEVLKNAPEKARGMFKVPKII